MRLSWPKTASLSIRSSSCDPTSAVCAFATSRARSPRPRFASAVNRISIRPNWVKVERTLCKTLSTQRFRFGRAAYCQMRPDAHPGITTGADDESEMGVYHHLYQSQRLANLANHLVDSIPAGFNAGIYIQAEKPLEKEGVQPDPAPDYGDAVAEKKAAAKKRSTRKKRSTQKGS